MGNCTFNGWGGEGGIMNVKLSALLLCIWTQPHSNVLGNFDMYFGKYWLILRFGKNFNVGLFHRGWSLKLHWALQFEYLGQFLFIYSSLASILLIKCEYVHDHNALRNFNLHYEGNNWCVSFLYKDHNVGTFSYARYSELCTMITYVGFNYTFMLVLLTLSIFKAKGRSIWFLKIFF